ncbi:hypothetical protein J27TS8_36980 [Robertmurraya siralis]|uniref:Uncharacterized protein n=1 Tax=Robertmurraya siralis TaxID=77777 RepID=A0A919WKF0_9BACI|nr:hypothetical protein [Robertmurraya siralis]GIN63705.1 hypothetical protein J27TS8_36980 [Robertmurraya siralis]
MAENKIETSNWNKKGKKFFFITFVLLIMMGFFALEDGELIEKGNSIWLLLIMLVSNVILIIQIYRNRQLYYLFGALLICAGLVLFIILPEIISLIKSL